MYLRQSIVVLPQIIYGMIISVLCFIGRLLLTFFLADLVSGLVHWWEDSFGEPDSPIIGKWIVQPNIQHHVAPAEFLKKNWWQSSWDLFLAGVIICVVAYYTGHFGWEVVLFSVLSANANQLHKYGHMAEHKVPWFVRIFIKAKVFQDARHHGRHHSGQKNTAYCVITPYLNPVLDKIGFWRGLEKVFRPWLSSRVVY